MATLKKVMKANEAKKTELQALRAKVKEQKSKINDLFKGQDKIEQYTRKNSLEWHGVPENLYTSTEEVVIKFGEVVNKPISSEDNDVSPKLVHWRKQFRIGLYINSF